MIESYLDSLRAAGYSESTLKISRNWLEHFVNRCPKELSKLHSRDLSAYHQSLHWEPGPSGKLYSENSVNQGVGVLKSYFRWCVKQGLLKASPADHLVTRRVPKKEQAGFTPSEIRALLDLPEIKTFTGLRDRCVLGLILEHQAKATAISRLSIDDFQADTGALLLKARKRRILTLGPGLQTDLERYLRLGRAGVAAPNEQALFVTKTGARMSTVNPREILRRYLDKAGLPN